MRSIIKRVLALFAIWVGCSAEAKLIAHYDFSDGDLLDNEVGTDYTLRQMKSDPRSLARVTLNTLEGTAVFSGGSALNGWLETEGPGELESFVLSFWFRTDQVSQGNRYTALFASNWNPLFNVTYPPGKLDWGLYSNRENGGPLELQVFQEKGLASDYIFRPAIWQHVVVRKRGRGKASHAELFLTPLDGSFGAPLVAGDDFDMSLKKMVLGVNRSGKYGYRMEMANVKVFDDASVPIESLFTEGPQSRSFEPVPLRSINRGIRSLGVEAANLRVELADLPRIEESLQLDAYGFHSSYLPVLDSVPSEPRWTVELEVDNVTGGFSECYLVPAADRRVPGMPGYGFPKRFRIISIDQEGDRKVIADWRGRDYPNPGRYPVSLTGSETRPGRVILEVYRGQVEAGREFFALDEIFVRTDYTFVKVNHVEVSGSFESPPFWSPDYLGDQKTSLGLPVLPGGGEPNDFSTRFKLPLEEPLRIELDLLENRAIDNIVLFPARPPEGVFIPGYGFPGLIDVEFVRASDKGDPFVIGTARVDDQVNPGSNIVRLPGSPGEVRWLRFSFDRLPMHQGSTVFALGEIEVANRWESHVDIAQARSDIPGAELLIDGKAGGATVLPMTVWFDGLMRGRDLSRRLDDVLALQDRLQIRWDAFVLRAWRFGGGLLLLIAGVAVIMRRISLQKMRLQVEQEHQLAELEQMKTRLFTHISHELRTPLTVILSRVERLMKRIREEEAQASLTKMHRNVIRLKVLVDQMLDLRTLQDGQYKMRCITGDFPGQVIESVESLRPLAEQKNTVLEVRSSGVDRPVWFDPEKLHKIVVNLVSNAIKYTPHGGRVDVAVRMQGSDAGITVEDSGMGIPPAELLHIFEQFYRVEEMRPVQAASSGIGLSLVKELVDFWGGRIEVESPLADGKGTRFTVMLPVGQPETENDQSDSSDLSDLSERKLP
jgi:signal transduction histidine kinase